MPLSYVQVCSTMEAFNRYDSTTNFQRAFTQLDQLLRYNGRFSSASAQDQAAQINALNLTLLHGMFSSFDQTTIIHLAMQLIHCGYVDHTYLSQLTINHPPLEHPPSI